MPGQLLLIAYYFPPLGGAGVQRPLKFARYLPMFGWVPHILTTDGDYSYNKFDPSLLDEFPEQGTITRVKDWRDRLAERVSLPPGLAKLLSRLRGKNLILPRVLRNRLLRMPFVEIPDAQVTWMESAYQAGMELIKKNNIDVIMSTSAPYSDHLLAIKLKNSTGLPWVADFRDEWSFNPYLYSPTSIHRRIHQSLEKSVLRQADAVISISEPILEEFKDMVPGKAGFHLITNGYDGEEINQVKSEITERIDSIFKMTYAGSLYSTPTSLGKALEGLLSSGKIPTRNFRLSFIGWLDGNFLNGNHLDKVLVFPGYLEHKKLLEELINSDVLVLIITKKTGAVYYSGKIYEYLALGKPILAIVPPEGVAARLVKESQAGIVVDPENIDEIATGILFFYNAWQEGKLKVEIDQGIVNKYDRKNLTRQLAKILDDLKR